MYQTGNKILIKRLQAGILVLVFAFLTGFAPVLHSHEFDFDEHHHDCAPCHWSQDNASAEASGDSLSSTLSIQPYLFFYNESYSFLDSLPVLNKSPPAEL